MSICPNLADFLHGRLAKNTFVPLPVGSLMEVALGVAWLLTGPGDVEPVGMDS